jgi:2-polyprenyl-6-methoxyphenol hydroxylase-like FAD-dependent oxidoreductase
MGQEDTMATNPGQFLSGKKIIVAGGGIAGFAFVIALRKLWDVSLPPPQITVFERDQREPDPQREGYSLSLNGTDKDGGLVALQDLGLLQETLACSIFELGKGGFKMWDNTWKELIAISAKGCYESIPVGTMRIARRDLRRLVIEHAEKAGATIHWNSMCTGVNKLDSGLVEVTVTDLQGGSTKHDCDLL